MRVWEAAFRGSAVCAHYALFRAVLGARVGAVVCLAVCALGLALRASMPASPAAAPLSRARPRAARKPRASTSAFNAPTSAPCADVSSPPAPCERESLVAVITDVRIVNGSFALYQISLSSDGERWSVWRRFKEFAAVRARIVRASPSESKALPSFPPRTFWKHLDLEFVQHRQERLSNFLQCVASDPVLRTRPDVRTFLGLAARETETIPTRDDHDAEGRAPPPPVTTAPRRPRFDFETFEMRDANESLAAVCQDAQADHDFKVRGPSYLTTRAKVPAGAALGRLFHLDIFSVREGKSREDHIVSRGRARARLEQLRELDGAPFVMVVNFQVPGTPPVSMCAYWGVPRPAPSGEDPECAAARGLFERFIDIPENGDLGAEAFNNQRFKLIPRIDEGPFVIRRAVGSKPTLLGQKVRQRYFRGPDYFELDIDVSSSAIATHIVSLCRGAARHLVVTLGIAVQGEATAELPEKLVGAMRLRNVDFDGSYEDLCDGEEVGGDPAGADDAKFGGV